MTHSLDHLVINGHYDIDQLAAWFSGLGFRLTPRGVHSLGSLNHLMMFDGHYLEIVGLPRQGKVRQELLASPVGIDGLVLASQDAEQTRQQLSQAGFSLQPLQNFSRQVVSGQQQGVARFTTVRLAPGEFSAGRVYFCQHHTPEWVWRPEWLGQDNGVSRITGLTVVADDPEALNVHYRRLGLDQRQFNLQLITPDQARQRYGDVLQLPAGRASYFAVIHFQGGRLDWIAEAATRLGLPLAKQPDSVRVALPGMTTLLEFIS
ncbi:VOC family protein [Biostraticola tofi]|uniref:Glyoxalase-like protein n=1 Tax=Biostraticola tofi TaxID=466109 RepID=A0A4R3Z4M5_9GAMM|nr:VOC family protein [Biostraticola tofi]TCW00133.1 glyoxalase-like protein [Biostraticola tofi]